MRTPPRAPLISSVVAGSALVFALAGPSPAQNDARRIRAVVAGGAPGIAEALADGLSSEDVATRRVAARSAARLAEVVRGAVAAAGRPAVIASHPSEVIEALRAFVSRDDLVYGFSDPEESEPGLDQVASWLRDGTQDERDEALFALHRGLSDIRASAGRLQDALADPDDVVREEVAKALATLDEAAVRARRVLLTVARTSRRPERFALLQGDLLPEPERLALALQGVGRAGVHAERVYGVFDATRSLDRDTAIALDRALDARSRDERFHVIAALIRLGAPVASFAPALAEGLVHRRGEPDGRWVALLRALGPDGAWARAYLASLLGATEDPGTAGSIEETLRAMGGPLDKPARAALEATLLSDEATRDARAGAARLLWELDGGAGVIEATAAAARETTDSSLLSILLAGCPGDVGIDVLLDRFERGLGGSVAVDGLARLLDDRSLPEPRLRALATHADANVRRQAMEVLARLGEDPRLLALARRGLGDREPRVRLEAIHAVEASCPSPDEGIRALASALDDPEVAVRELAVSRIGALLSFAEERGAPAALEGLYEKVQDLAARDDHKHRHDALALANAVLDASEAARREDGWWSLVDVALDDGNDLVRGMAAYVALVREGAGRDLRVKALEVARALEMGEVTEALHDLARTAAPTPGTLAIVEPFLTSDEPEVRLAAARAWIALGGDRGRAAGIVAEVTCAEHETSLSPIGLRTLRALQLQGVDVAGALERMVQDSHRPMAALGAARAMRILDLGDERARFDALCRALERLAEAFAAWDPDEDDGDAFYDAGEDSVEAAEGLGALLATWSGATDAHRERARAALLGLAVMPTDEDSAFGGYGRSYASAVARTGAAGLAALRPLIASHPDDDLALIEGLGGAADAAVPLILALLEEEAAGTGRRRELLGALAGSRRGRSHLAPIALDAEPRRTSPGGGAVLTFNEPEPADADIARDLLADRPLDWLDAVLPAWGSDDAERRLRVVSLIANALIGSGFGGLIDLDAPRGTTEWLRFGSEIALPFEEGVELSWAEGEAGPARDDEPVDRVRALGVLASAAGDRDRRVAVLALESLGDAGDRGADVTQALRRATRDRRPEVRAAAASALAILEGPRAQEALDRLLDDPAGSVREAATQALGFLGPLAVPTLEARLLAPPPASPPPGSELRQPWERGRAAAIAGLGIAGDLAELHLWLLEEAVPALVRSAWRERCERELRSVPRLLVGLLDDPSFVALRPRLFQAFLEWGAVLPPGELRATLVGLLSRAEHEVLWYPAAGYFASIAAPLDDAEREVVSRALRLSAGRSLGALEPMLVEDRRVSPPAPPPRGPSLRRKKVEWYRLGEALARALLRPEILLPSYAHEYEDEHDKQPDRSSRDRLQRQGLALVFVARS